MQSHDMHTYLDGQPSGTGLHALSPSATHTATIADRSRELLPHVLTLTLFIYKAVIFFCVAASLQILPVRKQSVLQCPDFPLALLAEHKRQTE